MPEAPSSFPQPGLPADPASLDLQFAFGEAALQAENLHELPAEVPLLEARAGDAPIARFLHHVLLEAVRLGASDLHFEPYEHHYRVRLRIDGELRHALSPPVLIKDKLASRIKVMSRLDIAEKRLPQDGRLKLRIDALQTVELRVSTLPTLHGEKIVIRILDGASTRRGIAALGYEPADQARLLDAIAHPHGMILVTGPTGSGKTVSLYACLELLNRPGVNICTVENPSEIGVPGINQVSVNDKAGLDFATVLKAFLRQDPDVIMLGEIRDPETADIAIKAAQTGHLVLSTLHTHDAPAAVTRLLNMGIAAHNIAASIVLVSAQRLARRLCPDCRQPADVPHQALLDAGFSAAELEEDWQVYRPLGLSLIHI